MSSDIGGEGSTEDGPGAAALSAAPEGRSGQGALEGLESGRVHAPGDPRGSRGSAPLPPAGAGASPRGAERGLQAAADAGDAAGRAQQLAHQAVQSGDPERAREAADQAENASEQAATAGAQARDVMRGSFGSEKAPIANIRDSAWRWIRAAAIVVTLLTSYQLLVVVRGIVSDVLGVALLLVFGAIVALLLQPLVDLLESRAQLSRTVAVLGGLLAGGRPERAGWAEVFTRRPRFYSPT